MKHQEKKYQVKSFDQVKKVLDRLGVKKSGEVVTNHYYGQHEGNDVTKLVEYKDKNAIHILKEKDGKFDLVESIPVESVKAGLKWLRDKGYKVVNLVKMANVDYEYKGGQVRLYTIDDWLKSVILDYPEGEHKTIAQEFRLEIAEVIKIPYNKQLEEVGKLRSKKLD